MEYTEGNMHVEINMSVKIVCPANENLLCEIWIKEYINYTDQSNYIENAMMYKLHCDIKQRVVHLQFTARLKKALSQSGHKPVTGTQYSTVYNKIYSRNQPTIYNLSVTF